MSPAIQYKHAFSLNEAEEDIAKQLTAMYGLSVAVLAKRLLMNEADIKGVKPDAKYIKR